MKKISNVKDQMVWRMQTRQDIRNEENISADEYSYKTLKEFRGIDHRGDNGKVSNLNGFVKHIWKAYKTFNDEGVVGYGVEILDNYIPETLTSEEEEMLEKADKMLLEVYTDGHIRRGKIISVEKETTGYSLVKPEPSGYRIIKYYAGKIESNCSLEKMMLIIYSIYIDKIPSDLDGITCNVKDGSGMVGNKYRASYNIDPEKNLEFCSRGKNSSCRGTLGQLAKITGCLYQVSALDNYLRQIIEQRTLADVLWYIKTTGIEKVKDTPWLLPKEKIAG